MLAKARSNSAFERPDGLHALAAAAQRERWAHMGVRLSGKIVREYHGLVVFQATGRR